MHVTANAAAAAATTPTTQMTEQYPAENPTIWVTN
jgi:hypothetical protein